MAAKKTILIKPLITEKTEKMSEKLNKYCFMVHKKANKIEIKKDKWIKDFDGKSLGDPTPEKWGVKKDSGIFDQFAGATITPRAVVKAVKGGLEFFAAHKSEITG